MKNNLKTILFISVIAVFISGCGTAPQTTAEKGNGSWLNLDTVKARKFDTGKMWTFENLPVDYFKETYGFVPSEDWKSHVSKSALTFASWCSASFVSEDGLIMTNHHCVDFITDRIKQEGENIVNDGFYAPTLSDERKVAGIYVDQLVLIQDVSAEIIEAINAASTNDAKLSAKNSKVAEIKDRYEEETGLVCKVTSLYNGGKYTLYGYKRYNDIRAVLVLESEMGLYGGDPDNFTYPRYNPDFAFMRAYDENGEPLKTENYFKWSAKGPEEGEPVFVIGNPGSTDRLKTVAQLEYMRDYSLRITDFYLTGMVKIFNEMIVEDPARVDEFKQNLLFVGNSAKVIDNYLKGLRDPLLLARKRDFEKSIRAEIDSDPVLKNKYGHLWNAIAELRAEAASFAEKRAAYSLDPQFSSGYFGLANDLVELAEQLKLPEDQRDMNYTKDNLESTVEGLIPDDFDFPLEFKKLCLDADFLIMNLGKKNEIIENMFGERAGKSAAEYALSKSILTDREKLKQYAAKGAGAILNSGDPFIFYLLKTRSEKADLDKRYDEIRKTESALEPQLGQALFAVYGTSIPPDATFTLRISDGMMKSYSYNGTVAPLNTTFYGLYDRFYSHKKKYPWALPERWANPGAEFDLDTPFNFISTNDIVGGSSGSPVINKNAEIIGLAFDGNIESIAGNFIYSDEANRMISVASPGIMELLSDLLKATRISEEIKAGKIPDEFRK